MKLDAVVLSLDQKEAEELEAQAAALEVADSVLDVRHAFFQVISPSQQNGMAETRHCDPLDKTS